MIVTRRRFGRDEDGLVTRTAFYASLARCEGIDRENSQGVGGESKQKQGRREDVMRDV